VAATLLDIERNPATGALWVAGTEARNRTRFEAALRGAALENRVVIAAPGGGVLQTLVLAPPFTTREHAQPALLEFLQGGAAIAAGARAQSGVGTLAFVGCLGSASVLALDATSTGLLAEIDTGEIPGGLAADAARGVLWVYTRGDHSLRAYDVAHGFHALGPSRPLAYDPEPLGVSAGRTHLYDARAATGHGNGNMSCASCHVFGHHDQLAWDLGNPAAAWGTTTPTCSAACSASRARSPRRPRPPRSTRSRVRWSRSRCAACSIPTRSTASRCTGAATGAASTCSAAPSTTCSAAAA
jgi:hypothetical protein